MFIQESFIPSVQQRLPEAIEAQLQVEEEVAIKYAAECEIDILFEEAVREGTVTPLCRFSELKSPMKLIDVANTFHVKNKVLSLIHQEFAFRSEKNTTFEVRFTLAQLFECLKQSGVVDVEIIGSYKLAHLFGKRCTGKALALQGLSDMWGRVPEAHLRNLFICNDIDLRFNVSGSPEGYTQILLAFLATKFQACDNSCDWKESEKQQLIKLYLIKKIAKSKTKSPFSYAMLSVGCLDLFFYENKLERNYLYFSDAWRVRCDFSSPTIAVDIEGESHCNEGWDSLLMQVFGVLDTDSIDNLNLQGVTSLICYYGKGKRPLRLDLESQFLTRLRLCLAHKSPGSIAEKLKGAIDSRFKNNSSAYTLCALNFVFFLEANSAYDIIDITAKPLVELTKDLLNYADGSLLSTLQGLLHLTLNPAIDTMTLPISAFLQTYAQLLRSQTFGGVDAKIGAIRRQYGLDYRLMLTLPAEAGPCRELVILDEFLSALKRMTAYAYICPENELKLLQKLFSYFIPNLPAASELFNLAKAHPVDNRSHPETLVDEIQPLLQSEVTFFRQLGFLLLCYHGAQVFSSQSFTSLIGMLPGLVAHEKSPSMRQHIFSQFCSYMCRGSKIKSLAPHLNSLENLYKFIGKNNVTVQELFKSFAIAFASVPYGSFASTACKAWAESSSYLTSQCDFDTGKQLLSQLPKNFHGEFLIAFKSVLKGSQEQYRLLSTLYFKMSVCQRDAKTLQRLSTVGLRLVAKAVTVQQIEAAGDLPRYYQLIDDLLTNLPQAGVAFLYALEKLKLPTSRFRLIICDGITASSYAKSIKGRAELLILWCQQALGEFHEGFHPSKTEAVIDLALEGYATTLAADLSDKLANMIVQLLLRCDLHGYKPNDRIRDKIALRRSWIFEHFSVSSACNDSDYCRFIRAMSTWGLPIILTPEQIVTLQGRLQAFLGDSDLLFDLLNGYDSFDSQNIMREQLLNHYLECSNFRRASLCIKTISESDHPANFISSVFRCISGFLATGSAEEGYRLLECLPKGYNVKDLQAFKDVFRNLFISLISISPKDALKMLFEFSAIFKEDHLSKSHIETLILTMMQQCLAKASNASKNMGARPVKSHRRPNAKSSQIQKKAQSTSLPPKPSLQIVLFEKLVSAISDFGISHPKLWTSIVEIFSSSNRSEFIEMLHLQIKDRDFIWEAHAQGAADFWVKLLLAATPGGAIFAALIPSLYMSVVDILEKILCVEDCQNSFIALAVGILGLITNDISKDANTNAIIAGKLISEKLQLNEDVACEPIRLAWMRAYIATSLPEVLSQVWKNAKVLLKHYIEMKQVSQIQSLHLLLEQSFPTAMSLPIVEVKMITPVIIEYIDLIRISEMNELLRPFVRFLVDLKYFAALMYAYRIAPRVFKNEIVEEDSKSFIDLQKLTLGLFHYGMPAAVFNLTNYKFYPQSLVRMHLVPLICLYLENASNVAPSVTEIQNISICYAAAVDMLQDLKTSERLKITEQLIDLLIPLAYNQDHCSLYNECLRVVLTRLTSGWGGAELIFHHALRTGENQIKMLLAKDCSLSDIQNLNFLTHFTYLEIPQKIHGDRERVEICKDRFCNFLFLLTKKLCVAQTYDIHNYSLLKSYAFIHIAFTIIVDKSRSEMLIDLLDEFSFHTPFANAIANHDAVGFFREMRDFLALEMFSLGCFRNTPKRLFQHYLLSEGFRNRIQMPMLPNQDKALLAVDIITRFCDKNNAMSLFLAIALLKQHQDIAFQECPEQLAICYDLIHDKLADFSELTHNGQTFNYLFTSAIAEVAEKLNYPFNFMEAQLNKYRAKCEKHSHESSKL